MARQVGFWGSWLDLALEDLQHFELGRRLLPINYPARVAATGAVHSPQLGGVNEGHAGFSNLGAVQTFEKLGPWDRETVEVEVSLADFHSWLDERPQTGQQACHANKLSNRESTWDPTASHKLLLFSANDYLSLSSHPAVRSAAAKAALECGMGPRAATLICGYTHHHQQLESSLAELKRTEDCLLCPTGFAANMAVMTALSSSIKGGLAEGKGAFAIFSDALNHASIIDGVRLAQKTGLATAYQYRHSDMDHLEQLLVQCNLERKVVVTDSLFSMDGDFAKMAELAALKQKYDFLWVVDDIFDETRSFQGMTFKAHGTLVCGENGGGVAEAFGVEKDVDIYVSTLSKAIGCHGGFIATSWKWKQWIQSRGRSFIFSTALPVPVVAAAHAAIIVAKKEKWRRLALWERVEQLSRGLGAEFTSPIVPIIIGGADESVSASRKLLKAGFHVFAIRPPTVKEGASRLRITLSAAHTEADVDALLAALPTWIKDKGRAQPFLSETPDFKWLPFGLQKYLTPERRSQLTHQAPEFEERKLLNVPMNKRQHNFDICGHDLQLLRPKL